MLLRFRIVIVDRSDLAPRRQRNNISSYYTASSFGAFALWRDASLVWETRFSCISRREILWFRKNIHLRHFFQFPSYVCFMGFCGRNDKCQLANIVAHTYVRAIRIYGRIRSERTKKGIPSFTRFAREWGKPFECLCAISISGRVTVGKAKRNIGNLRNVGVDAFSRGSWNLVVTPQLLRIPPPTFSHSSSVCSFSADAAVKQACYKQTTYVTTVTRRITVSSFVSPQRANRNEMEREGASKENLYRYPICVLFVRVWLYRLCK